jgi:hypothetical protein
MAKWESKTLAESGIIKAVGEQATAAIESVNAVMTLISGGAEVAKLFLTALGNPAAAAIALLADQIIAALNDYKELGFFALVINPFDENYGGKIKGEYGLEMVTDDNGNPYFKTSQVMNADSPFDGFTFTVSERYRETLNLENLTAFEGGPWRDRTGRDKEMEGFVPPIPRIVSPPKFVLGGYDPATWTGTIESVDTFPSLPAPDCIKLMADAFDDEGDIPKYEVINKTEPISKGPFTEGGGGISSYDPLKEYREPLFKSANTQLTTAERIPLTRQIQSGKPNYLGSPGVKVSALAIVVAAADFQEFIDGFKSLGDFLGAGVPDLSKIVSALEDLLTPDPIALTIEVNTTYGNFAEGDIFKGDDSGAVGKIQKIVSEADSVRTRTIYSLMNDVYGDLNQIVKEVINTNSPPIWKDTKIEYVPLYDPTNRFIPGEKVYQAEELIRDNPDGTTSKSYRIIGSQYKNNVLGMNFGRADFTNESALPKYGHVKGIDAIAPNSTPPDFFSLKAAEMVPGYTDFFDGLIEMANGLKGFAGETSEFIESLIEVINDLIEFFEDLVAKITAFLEFFTKGLPATGIYMLGITTSGGNDAIKSALTGSDDAPGSELKYSGGVLLVSVEINGVDPLVTFGGLLGLDFESV